MPPLSAINCLNSQKSRQSFAAIHLLPGENRRPKKKKINILTNKQITDVKYSQQKTFIDGDIGKKEIKQLLQISFLERCLQRGDLNGE